MSFWWPALASATGTALIVGGVLVFALRAHPAALIPLGLGIMLVALAASIGNL